MGARSRLGAALVSAFLAPAALGQSVPVVRDLKETRRDLVFRVEDLEAKAPDAEGVSAGLGMKETSTEVRIELAADVLFDFNKADLRPAAREALGRAAAVIREKRRGLVYVDGHTDAIGSDAYNQKLSERRASSVVAFFAGEAGLDPAIFIARGNGARKPVAPNARPDGSDDPEGRQKNRRVEIVVSKSGR